MATASPREFSQDFCRCLPEYVKTPLFIQPLSAVPLGRNRAESRSALRRSRATIAFLCKRKIKSGLNSWFLFTDEKLDLFMASFSWATIWSYLKYDFVNFALPNSGLMSVQIFFSYRTWINTESSCGGVFFQFYANTLLYEHLNTMLIFNVKGFFYSVIHLPFLG